MGAEQFYRDKHALRRNRLDLGAWQGFQEVLYKDPVRPRAVAFRFMLLRDGYVVFEYHRCFEADEYYGLRLSAHPRFPSAFLRVHESGEFLEKRLLGVEPVVPEQWHQCNIVFNDSLCLLELDGEPVGTLCGDEDLPQRIGFRGGYRSAFVDEVVIKERHNGSELRESFANRKHFPLYLFAAVLIFAILDICILSVARRRMLQRAHALMTVITFNMVLLGIAGFVWAGFIFVYSKQYPVVDEELLAQEERFVEQRTNIATKALRDSCLYQQRNVPLVLFLGTSQTWGAGITAAGEDFVSRIQHIFREGKDASVLCINGGVSGQDSHGLLEAYRDEWIAYEPDLVVINLGHNDNLPDAFAENLAAFAEINRAHGIKTLFVTEPLSTEKYPSEKETHQVMKKVAAAHDIPLIDMHHYLGEYYDSGFLWWDHVHPTSFGHRLIAERLYPAVLELISSDSSA